MSIRKCIALADVLFHNTLTICVRASTYIFIQDLFYSIACTVSVRYSDVPIYTLLISVVVIVTFPRYWIEVLNPANSVAFVNWAGNQ